MSQPDLERLLDRYRRLGDEGALATYVSHTAPHVRLLALRLTNDPHEADDLVQSTFATLLEKLDRLDLRQETLPWLRGVVTMHARNEFRKRHRACRQSTIPSEWDDDPIDDLNPEAVLGAHDFQIEYRKAVAETSASVREVLHRVLDRQESPQEVAEQLGLSREATRVRLHRGLQHLRERLRTWRPGVPAWFLPIFPKFLRTVSPRRFNPKLAFSLAPIGLTLALFPMMWREPEPSLPNAIAYGPAPSSKVELGSPSPDRKVATPISPIEAPLVATIVDAETGIPLPDVSVRLEATTTRRLVSTSSGEISFSLPQSGEIALAIEELGYAPHTLQGGAQELQDRLLYEGGVIALQPQGAVLEGRVRHAVDASAAASAELYLFVISRTGPFPCFPRSLATTGQDGHFRLERRLSRHPSTYDWVLIARDSTGRLGWARVPTVEGRDHVDVSIDIHQPIDASFEVATPDGEEVSVASIECTPCFSPWPFGGGDVRGWPEATTPEAVRDAFLFTTDSRGRTAVRLPMPGDVTVNMAASQDDSPEWDYVEDRFDYRVRVLAEGFVTEERRITLERGCASTQTILAHRCEDVVVHGRVQNEQGLPISGARVFDDAVPDSAPLAISDENGRFQWDVDDTTLLPMRLRCEAEGRFAETWDWTSAKAPIDCVFRLAELRTVEARVLDERGDPVPSARIRYCRAGDVIEQIGFHTPDAHRVEGPDYGKVFWRGLPLAPRNEALTDEDGEFTFDVPATREGRLVVEPPGYGVGFLGSTSVRIHEHVLTGDGVLEDIVLHRSPDSLSSVDIEVTCAETGRLLPPAEVVAFPDVDLFANLPRGLRLFEPSVTLSDGWANIQGLVPGPWNLFVHVQGHGLHIRRFTIGADEDLFLEAAVEKPSSVNGKIHLPWRDVDIEGTTLRLRRGDIFVQPIWGDASKMFTEVVLDEEGAFSAYGLTGGKWTVESVTPPLYLQNPIITLEAGHNEWETKAVLGTRLSLKPLNEPPDIPAAFFLRTENTPFQLSGQGFNGLFEITLPPDEYIWRVTYPKNLDDIGNVWCPNAVEGRVRLDPGQIREVQFDARKAMGPAAR